MNPITGHPVLRHLPHDLVKRPQADLILEWLQRKRKVFRRLRILSIVCTPLMIAGFLVIGQIHSVDQGLNALNDVGDIIGLLLFPGMAVLFYSLERQYRIPEADVIAVLNESDAKGHAPRVG